MVETEVNLRIVTCSEGDAFFMMAMIVILLTITTFLPLYSTSAMNFRENPQYDFPKIRGVVGSKAVWNFSENSSVLVCVDVPINGDDEKK